MEPNNNPPDFRSMIPSEFQNHPTLAPYKDLAGLVKSHIELNGMVGKNRIALPGDDASPEAWNAFYNQLGRPESPDKYGLKKPEDFPEGLNLPEPYLKFLSETFHKHGLTPKQAQGLFSELNQFAVKNFIDDSNNYKTQLQNLQNELEQEFGPASAAKRDMAKRAMSTFLDEKTKGFLEEAGLADHPMMTRLMAKIGEKLADPASDGSGGGGGNFRNLSPAQAQAEINTKLADEDFMKQYTNQFHPAHKQAVETMTALYEKLTPGNTPSE